MHVSNVNLDNYSGFWCVEPVRFSQTVDRVNRMDLVAHVESQAVASFDATATHFESLAGGTVAVVDIQGTMTKAGSSLGGGGTVEARHAIRQADRDQTVESIVLRIDSPGGTVAGTADLAAEVAKTTKPIVAYVEDLCASAAYWVASQCDAIYCNATTAQVGSIGTYMALYDISQALENEGVRAVVVKAGEFKGGGYPGTAISDEQVAEWQKMVDALQEQFTTAVSTGRNIPKSQAESLVTGLTYISADAESMKLIDGVKSFDDVVSELARHNINGGVAAMSEQPTEPQAATFKDIVAACPGIDPKNAEDALFIADCLADGMTASDANELYCETLRDQIKQRDQSIAAKDEEIIQLKAAGAKPQGVRAVGTQVESSSSDPQADWKAAVKAEQDKGKTKAEAVRAVNREQPELRQALVDASN